ERVVQGQVGFILGIVRVVLAKGVEFGEQLVGGHVILLCRNCSRVDTFRTALLQPPAMMTRTSEPLRAWLLGCDLAVTAAAWLLADALRLRSGLVPILAPDYPPFSLCLGQLPLIA